jgi:hypothetical protein
MVRPGNIKRRTQSKTFKTWNGNKHVAVEAVSCIFVIFMKMTCDSDQFRFSTGAIMCIERLSRFIEPSIRQTRGSAITPSSGQSLSALFTPTIMSHTRPVASSSSNFQQVFNNALKAYEKHSKNDLLTHPLAAQLQACDSPSAILLVIQQQVQDLTQSRTHGDTLTRWLDPMVNVLYAFSATLGEGVGLVRIRACISPKNLCRYLIFRRSHQRE